MTFTRYHLGGDVFDCILVDVIFLKFELDWDGAERETTIFFLRLDEVLIMS